MYPLRFFKEEEENGIEVPNQPGKREICEHVFFRTSIISEKFLNFVDTPDSNFFSDLKSMLEISLKNITVQVYLKSCGFEMI